MTDRESKTQRSATIAQKMVRYLALLLTLTTVGLLAAPRHSYQERAVAAVIMGEAWGQGNKGMVAVGEVIRERSVRLKRSPYKVVSASGRGGYHAFSCLNGTSMDALIRKFSKEADYQRALAVARLVCRTPDRLPGLTQGATHYCLATIKPAWAKGKTPVAVIGDHAFYRLRWI